MKRGKIFNKKVLILGASSDIGLEILKKYLSKGYNILAHYNKGNKKLFDLKKKNINRISLYKLNLLESENKINKFFKNKLLNDCDVVINASAHLKEIQFEKIDLKILLETFKVNLFPSIFLTMRLGPLMSKRGWGRIVNLGSIGVKFGGGKQNLPYSLSKHALEFFPSITKDWVKNNVLVNTIRVGATNTKLHKKLPSKNLKKRSALIPMKRMAEPKEIAEYVYFVGSDENTYISNQVLSISGGE